MRRATGFTLRELVVVILSVVLVAFLVLFLIPPSWLRPGASEMTRRANCLANLKGIGTALALYAQNYDNAYPMLPGCGWDNVPDGTNYLSDGGSPFTTTKPDGDWSKLRSVTSLMFMLVRDGESPKLFLCPSDRNAKMDTQTVNPAVGSNYGKFNWDFSSGQGDGGTVGSERNVSYSYQCPLNPGSGREDQRGISASPDPGLVVVADRTPSARGGTFNGAAGSPGAWSANIGKDDMHYYNSQNHSSGEMMNVLYVDGHAAAVKNPNCGPDVTATKTRDCIFSTLAGPPAAIAKDDGIDYGGSVDNTRHVGVRDTYLFGGGGK
jgi:prepilin-type processing-associated H-X9-DG protein